MKPFWPIVVGAIFATLCVWPQIVAGVIDGDLSLHTEIRMRHLVGYPATVVLLTVVWAILNRPQLERGRVSVAAMFGLVTILAVGLWFARLMLPAL